MQHPIRRLRGYWLLFCLTAGCMATQGLFGFDSGVYGGVSAAPDWKTTFPEVHRSNIAGITSSCFSLGAFVGCLLTIFYLGDKLGRRYTIVVGMLINVVGVALQVSSFSLGQMIAGRVINGFGIGLTSSTAPSFQAECSPMEYRGRLVVLGSLTNTFGVWIAGWVNFGVIYLDDSPAVWRFPLALQYIFIFVSLGIIPFVPESPRWLFHKDRQEEGLIALSQLFGKDINSDEVLRERDSILEAVLEEREHYVPVMDIIMCRDKTQNLRRMILGCGTMAMQQVSKVYYGSNCSTNTYQSCPESMALDITCRLCLQTSG